MRWAAFVLFAGAVGLGAFVPGASLLSAAMALVAGSLLQERCTRIAGSVRYIYDDGRCRLHLDECPVIPGAREGDLVVVDVRKVEG